MFSCAQASNRIVAWDTICEVKSGEIGSEVLTDGVKSMSLSRDGNTLASGGRQGTIAIWN